MIQTATRTGQPDTPTPKILIMEIPRSDPTREWTPRLHAMIGEHLGEDEEEPTVVVGIETERGPWVQALIAAGYQIYAVNPLQAARYRERHTVSGAKSDTGDAHVLADMVRTDRHQLRPVAGDSAEAEAVKVLSRAHKTLIWERTRHLLRLRHALREFFPAALVAFDDLTAVDALELLAAAPEPTRAAALGIDAIEAALKKARRHNRAAKGEAISAAPRAEHLDQPPVAAAAYAVTVRAQAAILTVLNTQIAEMEEQVEASFSKHRDADIYLSQPGLGAVLGARVLGEFGDAKQRYADGRARRNYAGTSPITRQSGKKKVIMARYVHNDRLLDALGRQAFCALRVSLRSSPAGDASISFAEEGLGAAGAGRDVAEGAGQVGVAVPGGAAAFLSAGGLFDFR